MPPVPVRRVAFSVLVAATLAGCTGTDPGPGSGAASPGKAAATSAPPPASSPTSLRPPPPELGIVAAGKRPVAPDLSVTAFDGRTITLGGFRGQPAVVNFFESW